MNKEEKLKFQKQVETYLERKRIYDMFQDLLKELVVHKPDHPIDFLIERLERPQRYPLTSQKGSEAFKKAKAVASLQKQAFEVVSVGQLLKAEVAKKSPAGVRAAAFIERKEMVPDDVVWEVVKHSVNELVKAHRSFMIQGFPLTRVQGLSMQRAGLIPDCLLILNQDRRQVLAALTAEHAERDRLTANQRLEEYELNIGQVKETFKNYYFDVALGQQAEKVTDDISRLLKFRMAASGPKGCINILVVRPPGRNWALLGPEINRKYGLVFVSAEDIVAGHIARKTQLGKLALKMEGEGEIIPDDVLNGLIMSRLNQVDCYMQGTVLEGFPATESQIACLEELKIHPNLVVLVDVKPELVTELLKSERVDPLTGEVYNSKKVPSSQAIRDRLVKSGEQSQQAVQKKVNRWKKVFKEVEKKFDPSKVQKLLVREGEPFGSQVATFLQKISFKLEKGL